MKKLLGLMLAFTLVLGLLACTSKDAEMGQNDEQTSNTPQTDPPATVNPDAEMKAELLEKYGGKFEFYLAFDMQLINFNFDETTVVRQHFDSLKDEQPTHNGTWDIVNGELVVSGEWNEIFILNLESNKAISKSDGREYPIYKAE
jgi:hypothetical protein